jgi:hypothetical protein
MPVEISPRGQCKKAMGAASVSEIALFRQLPGVLRVLDFIITALPSAVIGD